jgi:hypothetical protein
MVRWSIRLAKEIGEPYRHPRRVIAFRRELLF